MEIGRDQGSRVTQDYTVHEFTGDVNWVEITIPEGAPDSDDEISPAERLRAALVVE